MTTIYRVKTSGPTGEEQEIEIEIEIENEPEETKITIEIYFTAGDYTEPELLAEAEAQAGGTLTDIFFHINADDSIAVATGAEPDTWPEDEE